MILIYLVTWYGHEAHGSTNSTQLCFSALKGTAMHMQQVSFMIHLLAFAIAFVADAAKSTPVKSTFVCSGTLSQLKLGIALEKLVHHSMQYIAALQGL